MLKIVIGTNEGKVLCISNNENKIKESMVNYLIDTDQEPTEDFFESRNWGEYDIEVYEYHQPQLNDNQQIVLEWLKLQAPTVKPMQVIFWMMNNAAWGKLDELRNPIMHLTDKQQAQVLEEFGKWVQEQEAE